MLESNVSKKTVTIIMTTNKVKVSRVTLFKVIDFKILSDCLVIFDSTNF